ncbi:phosphate ABC transporter permease subunit PstC [Candidatus Microgenomates bacterium]|nr:phosphate ABC transporter permease subunit PstC [Candidatus Microgenomates bacterium]
MKYYKEIIIEKCIKLVAMSTISILILIIFFIFRQGVPFLVKYGLPNFILGQKWLPQENIFGILPMIIGSLWVTIGALIIGVPIGVACAIYLVEFSGKHTKLFFKPAIELLAGIPSVVYGFIGIMVLAPFIRSNFGGSGLSVLTASIVLGIMILPTIVSISIDALSTVPLSYKEGSIAMGATNWQTIVMVLLPAARSGILAGVILGMGRAIGETMAVIMVTGNSLKIPSSALDSTRTMTSNIALEMGYALGDHRAALFATAVILFIFILLLNIITMTVIKSKKTR